MIGFGLLGYVLRRFDYPLAPLVLGIVLGDLLDKNFRRGLVLSDGSLLPFLTRPISLVLWLLILRHRRSPTSPGSATASAALSAAAPRRRRPSRDALPAERKRGPR